MNRSINSAGAELIKRFESCRLVAYICPAGYVTVGWGHRNDHMCPGQRITQNKADQLFENDVALAVSGVLESTKGISLSDNELSALASLVFNIGKKQFDSSTLLKKLKAGDKRGAADQFDRWVYGRVNGKPSILPGLVKRRVAEKALFCADD